MIHFISGEYPPDIGGLGDYTARLRAALSASGYDSSVISRRQIRRWDARALVYLLRTAPRSGVLHIQFQAAAYQLLGDVCLVPALLRRIRPRLHSITTFHDVHVPYLFPRAGRLRAAAVRLLARTSDAVIAADSRDLEFLGGPSPRHFNVPIGSNVDCSPPPGFARSAFRQRLDLQPNQLALVYFGLLNASKGLDLLLDTFDRIGSERPGTRLLLLGGPVGASDATDRETARQLESRLGKLGDRLIRPGWLAPHELSAHLLAGDIALLPYADGASARRGSLLACAEHGLPIVSTRPAAPEVSPYIQATEADAASLATAVLNLHAEPEQPRKASRALADRVRWPGIADQHAQIYKSLLYSCSPK